MTWLAIVVLVTIAFSFTCSIWEAALYSVPPGRVESLRQAGSSRGVRLSMLREKMDRPVSAILTLNTIAHTAGATIAGGLVQVYLGGEYLTSFSIAFVFVILVFSEIIPKTLGYSHAASLAPIFAWPIQVLVWCLYPAVVMSEWIAKILRPSEKEPFPTEEDILSVAHLGLRSGEILPEELKWVKNVLYLNNVEAKNIMTPKTEIQFLDPDMSLEDLKDEVPKWEHSRIPLARNGDLDDITGIILRHEAISALCEDRMELKLSDLARPTHTVRAEARCHLLLKEMIRRRQHLFIVTDEKMDTIGIVTLEDVIEEMLGEEIEDETEAMPEPRGMLRKQKRYPKHEK